MFKIIKFATMLLNSPNMPGGTITTRNDPRVLPFGKILRMTKINELPQIFNVLNGTMSIVGPRPLVKEGYDFYSDEMKRVIYQNKPGVTGIGSIVFRDEEKYLSKVENPKLFYKMHITPFKGELELWYRDNKSLYVDFVIIFLTAWLIIFPKSKLPEKVFSDLPPVPTWL